MIQPAQLLTNVIRPVLKDIGLWSPSAERLIIGTACVESNCGYDLVQHAGGPALGIYEMEPGMTGWQDCYVNFLNFRPSLRQKVDGWRINKLSDIDGATEMVGNLYYATAMARIKYVREPAFIPDTLPNQAAYWKRVYNTPLGAGTAEKYITAWRRYIDDKIFT